MVTISASDNLIAELRGKLSLVHGGDRLLLSRKTVALAINRFLGGEINEEELVAWANLLETEDRVCYEPGHEKTIADVVFQVASPEINAPLVRSTCEALLGELVGSL
jgi:hypothetical protein